MVRSHKYCWETLWPLSKHWGLWSRFGHPHRFFPWKRKFCCLTFWNSDKHSPLSGPPCLSQPEHLSNSQRLLPWQHNPGTKLVLFYCVVTWRWCSYLVSAAVISRRRFHTWNNILSAERDNCSLSVPSTPGGCRHYITLLLSSTVLLLSSNPEQ